ncbi:MAG TPA: MIP/aquaporin family protein [Steroidobacteraceae bacterium]|nr:MIP/aquaporin family protein [Steroidobacteraceae bacterium]
MSSRPLIAECLGSMLLAAAVIGSGIMAQRLAAGNQALALLANTAATVAVLATLIALVGPISGAHLNPAVSIIETLRGRLTASQALGYIVVQVGGCVLGALLAHAMFGMPLIQSSLHVRSGFAQWLSEGVATAGLILVVMGAPGSKEAAWRVAAWIGAAYWFTASTSFANPAITIARSLTDTFSGIAPVDVPAFIVSQLCGAVLGLLLGRYLLSQPHAAQTQRVADDADGAQAHRSGCNDGAQQQAE